MRAGAACLFNYELRITNYDFSAWWLIGLAYDITTQQPASWKDTRDDPEPSFDTLQVGRSLQTDQNQLFS
jgi:hypothetical protein